VRRVWFEVVALVGGTLLAPSAHAAADPAAAERQYRAARRLVAEGSAEAGAALRKVAELDPTGAWADDAWVDLALLERPARWPEELGEITEPAARRAGEILDRVVAELPAADRAAEARYYRALLHLERLPVYDAARARADLLAVAAPGSTPVWAHSARYAAAWILEQSGALGRAADAYGRLLVDAPDSEPATRARVAAARVALRRGDAGRAAALTQRAIDDRVAPQLGAEALRELSLRSLLAPTAPRAAAVERTPSGVRSLAGFALVSAGALVGEVRTSLVLKLGAPGGASRWTVAELQAITVDPLGRIYAAAGERVYRLAPDGLARPIAHQGDFGPVTGLAADAAGRLWVLDRKRERIGRIDPAASAPVTAWTRLGARLVGLAWDGSRVVTVDAREKLLLAAAIDGPLEPAGLGSVQKPVAFAVDRAGAVAVLDERDDAVHVLTPEGDERVRIDCKALGITKPQAIAFEPDGAIGLFDGADGSWVRLP
jgi:hypothetical protein